MVKKTIGFAWKAAMSVVLVAVLSPHVLTQTQLVTKISAGSALPTNCLAGNIFVKTSSTVGPYWCSTPGSPGTWSLLGSGTGTVTNTGTLTSGQIIKGNGGVDITVGNLAGDVTTSGSMTTTIGTGAVSLSKIANASANSKLLGSGASGSGSSYSELTLGTNLSMSGTTLNASGGGGSGSLILVDTETASASSTLDFTTGISSTYSHYVLDIQNLIPATSGQSLVLQVSTDTGSTWAATNYWRAGAYYGSAGAAAAVSSESDTTMLLGGISATTDGYRGKVDLYDLASSATSKFITGQIGLLASNDGHRYVFLISGWWVGSSTVDGLRLKSTSGNLTSGTVRLYGVSH